MNKDLTVGKPERVLWRYCIPLLGSVIFQQLYNIADSLVAGKYVGKNALAAVGNSYEITLIYMAFAFGCNMGCSVIAAQFFGAKNYRKMKTTVYTTFIYSAVLCLILTLTGLFAGGALLHLIHTPADIFADSKLYLDVYTGGLVFLFFYNIATGIFTAMGDSRTPFIFLALSSTANIAVDILFVTAFRMGVAGVAWATFLCQGVSALLACLALMKRLRNVTKGISAPVFSSHILSKIIVVAVPSILQQSFISVGNIVIQSIINSFGAVVMAGYAAAIKLNNLVITSITTIGNGVSSFTAQNLGAGKQDRVTKGWRGAILMAMVLALSASAIYIFAGSSVMKLFVNSGDEAVIDVGISFFRIASPFYLVILWKIISDGVLRGSGAMKEFMIATFTDLILRVVLAYGFSKFLPLLIPDFSGVIGIWLSWPVGWTLGTIVSLYFYHTGRWRREFLETA